MRLEKYARRTPISGGWSFCLLQGGFIVRRSYLGYTKKEAVAEFRREFPLKLNPITRTQTK